jgi:hypothetical protein
VERSPVNDYAHFCLGRAFQMTGHRTEARRHLKLAAGLRPDRKDYREYLDRIRAAKPCPQRWSVTAWRSGRVRTHRGASFHSLSTSGGCDPLKCSKNGPPAR